jgi:L-lysine exporter family protein LysE/ArgO
MTTDPFKSLGFGAAILRPLFEKPSAWRVPDGAIGLTMWAIAANLLLNAA